MKPGNLSLAIVLWAASGCTFVGQGEGEVFSDNLSVPTCWFGAFDLDPDFFATVPFRVHTMLRKSSFFILHSFYIFLFLRKNTKDFS